MGGTRLTPDQIIGRLREAELLLGQGKNIGEAIRQIGVHEQTYYRWRKECGGMRVDQARRLKERQEQRREAVAVPCCLG